VKDFIFLTRSLAKNNLISKAKINVNEAKTESAFVSVLKIKRKRKERDCCFIVLFLWLFS